LVAVNSTLFPAEGPSPKDLRKRRLQVDGCSSMAQCKERRETRSTSSQAAPLPRPN